MDLHDFSGQAMYFDEPVPENIQELLNEAALAYGTSSAELFLQQAYEKAPTNASVLVALYRYYYYQHRLEEALGIADIILRNVAGELDLPEEWQELSLVVFSNALMISFTKVRFYLMALKGAAYLKLRLGRLSEGITMLNKIIQFDSHDRLGAQALLQSVLPSVGFEEFTQQSAI